MGRDVEGETGEGRDWGMELAGLLGGVCRVGGVAHPYLEWAAM